jgi:hypothetical protein
MLTVQKQRVLLPMEELQTLADHPAWPLAWSVLRPSSCSLVSSVKNCCLVLKRPWQTVPSGQIFVVAAIEVADRGARQSRLAVCTSLL